MYFWILGPKKILTDRIYNIHLSRNWCRIPYRDALRIFPFSFPGCFMSTPTKINMRKTHCLYRNLCVFSFIYLLLTTNVFNFNWLVFPGPMHQKKGTMLRHNYVNTYFDRVTRTKCDEDTTTIVLTLRLRFFQGRDELGDC